MNLTDEQIAKAYQQGTGFLLTHRLDVSQHTDRYGNLAFARAIEAEVLRINGGGGEAVKCPIGLEANHNFCSAGYCDVCKQARGISPQPQQAAPGAVPATQPQEPDLQAALLSAGPAPRGPTQDWLAERLAVADDGNVGAGPEKPETRRVLWMGFEMVIDPNMLPD